MVHPGRETLLTEKHILYIKKISEVRIIFPTVL